MTRQSTSSTTAAADPSATSPNQLAFASLPVPNAWTSATGHAAYASQCTSFHERSPIRPRTRLVAISASKRSNATAPSPSQMGR